MLVWLLTELLVRLLTELLVRLLTELQVRLLTELLVRLLTELLVRLLTELLVRLLTELLVRLLTELLVRLLTELQVRLLVGLTYQGDHSVFGQWIFVEEVANLWLFVAVMRDKTMTERGEAGCWWRSEGELKSFFPVFHKRFTHFVAWGTTWPLWWPRSASFPCVLPDFVPGTPENCTLCQDSLSAWIPLSLSLGSFSFSLSS